MLTPALLLLCALAAPALASPGGGATVPARLHAAGADGVLRFSPDVALDGGSDWSGVVDPVGLAFGPGGRLWVSSGNADAILVLDDKGNTVATLGLGTPLSDPGGLAFGPNGELYVASTGSDEVLVFSAAGLPVGALDGGGLLDDPVDLVVAADGHLLVACSAVPSIVELDPSGAVVAVLGDGLLPSAPTGLALAADGRVLVSCGATDELFAIDADGAPVPGWPVTGSLDDPAGLAVGPDGVIYVASRGDGTLRGFDPAGAEVFSVEAPLGSGGGLAFAPHRFSVTVKGSLLTASGQVSIHDAGTLSLDSGAGRALLELPAGDFAAAFGTSQLSVGGVRATMDGKGTKAESHTTSFDADPEHPGATSMHLKLRGKVDAEGRLALKGARGNLFHSSPAGVFRGTVKTKKALP